MAAPNVCLCEHRVPRVASNAAETLIRIAKTRPEEYTPEK